jgi:hypothetical protein
LNLWDSTLGEQLGDGVVGGLGVTDMLALALAAWRTLSFEGPNEANILVEVLGNGDILSFHHAGDVSELGFPEAFEGSSVGVGVKHGGRHRLLARHPVLVGSIGSALGHFKHVVLVPLGRQLTKAGHTEGQDCVNDLVERRGSRMVSGLVLSSSPDSPSEVVLLGFIEDTIDMIHASSGNSCLGVDDLEPRSDGLDKIAHVGSNWVLVTAMEDVDEDGPGIELFYGRLWRGRELHIRECELLCIRKRQRSARLSYFGLLDHKLDSLRLRVAFTHACEWRKPSPKEMPVQATRLERTEDLVCHLGGHQGKAASGDKLRSPKAAGHAEQKVDKWWSNSAVY